MVTNTLAISLIRLVTKTTFYVDDMKWRNILKHEHYQHLMKKKSYKFVWDSIMMKYKRN